MAEPMLFQGTKNCSANPNYPAATAGYVYVVSVAGKIGGKEGVEVNVGDQLLCLEAAAEGTQAEVGSKWAIQRGAESLSAARRESYRLINVEHYGADPSSSDNHEAFERAMAAAVEAERAVVYFPPTGINKRWLTSKQIKFPLDSHIHFLGHGEAGEIGLVKEDLPYGQHLFEAEGGESEASHGNEHWFDGIWIKGLSKWYGSPTGAILPGYRPCNAMGFLAVSGMKFYRCCATEFYAGWDLRENALCVLEQCKDAGCFYGRYVGPTRLTNQFIAGGWSSRDHESVSATWAAIGVHADVDTEGTTLIMENQIHCPYSFYKEGPQGIGAGFLASVEIKGGAQEVGNAFIYDESMAASFPAALRGANSSVSMRSPMINISLNAAFGVGQSQTLEVTATGGTFTITLPKIPNRFEGATTEPIKYNATPAEIKTAISKVVTSSTVYVTAEEGKSRIQIFGVAMLQAEAKMTLGTGSLTGGTATLTEPELPPEMGPLVRPVTPKVVEVKNATGGTFTLKVKVGGGEEVTSKPIKYNATKKEFHEVINEMANVTPSGVVVSGAGATGVFYVYFLGSLLGKEVLLSADGSSLTGTGAEVTVSPYGTEVKKANLHGEYAIDTGSFALKFYDALATCAPGTAGFVRGATESSLILKGNAGAFLLTNTYIEEGKKVVFETYSGAPKATRWSGFAEIDGPTKGGHVSCFLMSVEGPIEIGNLIAPHDTEGRGVIYPVEAGYRRESGNTAASEVETLEISHLLNVVPSEVDIQLAASGVVSWVITELTTTKIKLKFGAKTAKEAKVYWTVGTARVVATPHAGFAYSPIAAAKSAVIPIVRSASPVGTKVLYDSVGTPAINTYLKPSAVNAGKVTTATEPTDHLVAVAVAAGLSGKVAVVPLGGI